MWRPQRFSFGNLDSTGAYGSVDAIGRVLCGKARWICFCPGGDGNNVGEFSRRQKN